MWILEWKPFQIHTFASRWALSNVKLCSSCGFELSVFHVFSVYNIIFSGLWLAVKINRVKMGLLVSPGWTGKAKTTQR